MSSYLYTRVYCVTCTYVHLHLHFSVTPEYAIGAVATIENDEVCGLVEFYFENNTLIVQVDIEGLKGLNLKMDTYLSGSLVTTNKSLF